MQQNIAIDGPAGAGKSTVAQLVAQKLGLTYVDTGAIYRALTWKALKENLPFEEEPLALLARNTKINFISGEPGTPQRVFCDSIDVTENIREPKVSQWVSALAAFGEVRQELMSLQKRLAIAGGVVMDGRDIGTRILPEASFKFFLTASLDARSLRRYQELKNKGTNVTLAEIRQNIMTRDQIDENREASPLAIAKDAKVIDTTNFSIEEVVNLIANQYQDQGGS